MTYDKTNSCCFTGHRKLSVDDRIRIFHRLRDVITELIEQGYWHFLAGGALGFDTLAALTVLDMKADYPQIRLTLALPCVSQTSGWGEEDRERYEHIKATADEVVYTSQEYTRGCMHKRNRYLVDNSSVCVAYMTVPAGGTAYTVKRATEKSLRVINIGG